MAGRARLDKVDSGEASVGRKLYGLPPLTERVRVARLDTLVASGELPPPRVMKIDVEGAETLVLDGAEQVLRDHHPELAIELHSIDKSAHVLNVLERHGYACFAYLYENGEWNYRRVRAGEEKRLMENDHIIASTNAERVENAVAAFR